MNGSNEDVITLLQQLLEVEDDFPREDTIVSRIAALAPDPVDELVALFSHGEIEIQAAAVLAVGRLWNGTWKYSVRNAIPAIVALSNSDEPYLVLYVAKTLQYVGRCRDIAAARTAWVLSADDRQIRRHAGRLLRHMWRSYKRASPRMNEAVLPVLIDMLPDEFGLSALHYEDHWVYLDCAAVLGEIGPAASPVATTLESWLEYPNADIRLAAASALAGIGTDDFSPVLAILIDSLESSDFDSMSMALNAVAKLGQQGTPAVPVLVKLLKRGLESSPDAEYLCRMAHVCGILAEIGHGARNAVPALVACIDRNGNDDLDRWLQLDAADAIWKITGRLDQLLAVAANLVTDDEFWLRCQAVEALGELGAIGCPVREHLSRALCDEHEDVFRSVKDALALIDISLE